MATQTKNHKSARKSSDLINFKLTDKENFNQVYLNDDLAYSDIEEIEEEPRNEIDCSMKRSATTA